MSASRILIPRGISATRVFIPWKKEGHIYTSNAGLKELKVEIDHYLDRHYGVSYDPDHEIMVTIGGSEAIDVGDARHA